MTLAFFLAVTASFASKTKSSRTMGAFYFINPGACSFGITEQEYCYDIATGPACTVYNSGKHSLAYSTYTMPCTVLLRQPD